ncbi:MAG: hypothetical protein EA385_12320 [Salinarimonadaceae bacterium]|nr:MAG: hypothetical protein EA385_12320 [Salinarimonadaceae bacterium]
MSVAPLLPTITDENRPFWDAARAGRFRMQRCSHCATLRPSPSDICPHCLSEEFAWVDLSGRGAVSSWCVYHRAFHPAFKERVPYTILQVDLDEGVRFVAPLAGGGVRPLKLGMRVRVVFEEAAEDVVLPVFALEEDVV